MRAYFNVTHAQHAVDNALYTGLFSMTISAVNDALGLPPTATEDQRRDEMGIVALSALRHTENAMAISLNNMPADLHESFTLDVAVKFAHDMGKVTADTFRERGLSGVALLTAAEAQS